MEATIRDTLMDMAARDMRCRAMGDKGLHVVSKVSDLPEAVEGVIHLPGGSAWLILGSVAVEGLQIKVVTVQLANETTAGSNVTATDLQLVISALNG